MIDSANMGKNIPYFIIIDQSQCIKEDIMVVEWLCFVKSVKVFF